ncbi:hypothetical protein ACFQU1_10670 [Chelatococcus sp. GCM10030263]|uniref:hypothetical protein n=1 Tax=Chelatococcus sp. GCM10030263 TaxID=3273387 RepID=UPI00360E6ED2
MLHTKAAALIAGLLLVAFAAAPAEAQEPPESAICRKAAIATLKAETDHSPLKDVKLDLDSLTVAKSKGDIEGIKVTTVLIGQATIQRESSDEPHTFLCLLGENDKVLLTFFTKR